MNSVRLVCDGGAGKVEGKGREMSQRARARSGRSAAVRTVECRMIVESTDAPAYAQFPVRQTLSPGKKTCLLLKTTGRFNTFKSAVIEISNRNQNGEVYIANFT